MFILPGVDLILCLRGIPVQAHRPSECPSNAPDTHTFKNTLLGIQASPLLSLHSYFTFCALPSVSTPLSGSILHLSRKRRTSIHGDGASLFIFFFFSIQSSIINYCPIGCKTYSSYIIQSVRFMGTNISQFPHLPVPSNAPSSL